MRHTVPTNGISFTIKGEPASKANSRRIIKDRKGMTRIIKSDKALSYVTLFKAQCPKLRHPYQKDEDLAVTIHIYYRTRRPDLDESVILDAMQGRIYENDRQVKEKHVYWGLDASNPRAEIAVRRRDG